MNPGLASLLMNPEAGMQSAALQDPRFGGGMQMPQQPPMGGMQMPQQPQFDPRQMNTIPYVVKKGDNITKIARGLNVSVSEILKSNPELKNPQLIFPGQELRVPIKGAMGEMGTVDPRMEMQFGHRATPDLMQQSNRPEYWQNRDAMSPEQRMQRDMMLGGAAGLGALGATAAGPLAGAVGAAPAAALGGLARLMPRQLPPAGRPAFPMSKGAVDWPGAAKTWSNVRPLNIPVGAERAMGVSARNALARAREAQEFGRAEPTRAQLEQMMRILGK